MHFQQQQNQKYRNSNRKQQQQQYQIGELQISSISSKKSGGQQQYKKKMIHKNGSISIANSMHLIIDHFQFVHIIITDRPFQPILFFLHSTLNISLNYSGSNYSYSHSASSHRNHHHQSLNFVTSSPNSPSTILIPFSCYNNRIHHPPFLSQPKQHSHTIKATISSLLIVEAAESTRKQG